MNREIKFRAWVFCAWDHFDNGWQGIWTMVEVLTHHAVKNTIRGRYIDSSGGKNVHNYDIDEKNILMQYTGLLDKNGVEIFEGDIVKDCEDGDLSEVAFMDGEYVYVGFCESITNRHWVDFEVVGNVWEHKELLESK